MIIFVHGAQALLYVVSVILAYVVGYVCRYIYVGERKAKIFFGVETLYQEKKDNLKLCTILAPSWVQIIFAETTQNSHIFELVKSDQKESC